jgi:leader peptidase (prepilin peptidase)/N-methyltransferase
VRPEEVVALPFVVAFGAVVGSFANVCIHRLPRGLSVVAPRSACPACGTPIAAYDNVPVVSWLLLRGRCRSCRAPIRARYPLVEALVAALFLAAALRHGLGPVALGGAILATAAVILAATDLESRVLPDEVTLGVLVLGLLVAAWRDLPALQADGARALLSGHLATALAGAAFGAALVWGVGEAYRRLRGAEGMGLGDVKMAAKIGAFVGPAGVLLTLFAASAAGTLLAGLPALFRSLAWRAAFVAARRSEERARSEAARRGLLAGADGTVLVSGARWREIPGAPREGTRLATAGPVARPAAAFVRLALRRAATGRTTSFSRLALEDETGDFFRVLAARAEPGPGGLLVLLSRVDVPFGVFLAAASVAVWEWGGRALELLLSGLPVPGRGLLP